MTTIAATQEQRTAFEQSRATALDSATCLLSAFRLLGVPDSMLDVGCGDGHLVRIAAALGIDSAGMDIALPNAESGVRYLLICRDLTDPFSEMARYDLVLCLEVAEHLPRGSADTLCATLAEATGGTLLFSAATPGQGGSGHLNEQPHEYWREKLEARGLRFDDDYTAELRGAWTGMAPSAWWYGRNLMCFRRGSA